MLPLTTRSRPVTARIWASTASRSASRFRNQDIVIRPNSTRPINAATGIPRRFIPWAIVNDVSWSDVLLAWCFGPVLGSNYLVLHDDTGKQNSLTNLNFRFQSLITNSSVLLKIKLHSKSKLKYCCKDIEFSRIVFTVKDENSLNEFERKREVPKESEKK